MKTNSFLISFLLTATVILATCILTTEGRGGRRGGSFGGVFGNWRKSKKTVSASSLRRSTHGTSMYTSGTKSLSSSSSSSLSSTKPLKATKHTQTSQSSYPKQQLPFNSASQLPPGGSYYTAALPPGAIYYPQPPIYASSDNRNFLFGMAAGHMLSNTHLGHRTHVTHVYHQQSPQRMESNGAGGAYKSETTETSTNAAIYDGHSNIPSAPFNAAIAEGQQTKTAMQMSGASTQVAKHHEQQQLPHTAKPQGGIICMPAVFNETDPSDSSKMLHVEKIICYPAPPPPTFSPPSHAPAATAAHFQVVNKICFQRNVTEADPNDPTKTIITQREECVAPTTTPRPQVAGEIGENIDSEKIAKASKNTSASQAETASATSASLSGTTTAPALN